jgi:surface antigen
MPSVLGWSRLAGATTVSPAAATSSLGSLAGVVVPTSPTGLRDALTAAAQAQLEAAQVQSLQVVGKMWSTLAGNGAAALDEVVLSDSGEECITPSNELHMPTCEVRALGTSGPGSSCRPCH